MPDSLADRIRGLKDNDETWAGEVFASELARQDRNDIIEEVAKFVEAEEAQPLPVVDRQCHCQMCEERTKATYRVVARCYNCGQRMIEVYRVGDTVGGGRQCPTCGVVYRVYTDGAATAALREGTTDD